MLSDTSTSDQSGSGSNGYEGILHTFWASELEFHQQIQFSAIPRIYLFLGVLLFVGGWVSVF